jgi:hypothetical protein
VQLSIGMPVPPEDINLCGDKNMKGKSYRLEAIKRNQQLEIPENCLLLSSSQPLTGIRFGK